MYEGLVVAVFLSSNRDGAVVAEPNDEFYQYLNCTASPCEGTFKEYLDFFFGEDFTKDHLVRNAGILGGILFFVRVMTWLALEFIRFG